jgi:16S rRNA (cytosine967-C5)-methyltransferase
MLFSTLVSHTAELLRIVLKSPKAPDLIASEYFRQKKYIGSKDRKFISESLFNALRNKVTADFILPEICLSDSELSNSQKSFQLLKFTVLSSLFIAENYPNRIIFSPSEIYNSLQKLNLSLKELIDSAAYELGYTDTSFFDLLSAKFEKLIAINPETSSQIASRYSFPQYFTDKFLSHERTYNEIFAIAESLLFPAPLCLRVNNKVTNVDSVVEFLHSNSIKAEKSKLSPSGIIIDKRVRLNDTEIFQKGQIEVQDVGSQLIAFALAPEPNTDVLDACAGAGGKSLHIADLQNDTGHILATDIEFNRLKEIKGRAAKSGISSISTQIVRNFDLHKSIKKKFDYVLVDAPCSGTGTMRRNPLPKWNLNDKLLKKLNQNQAAILQYYSQFVEDDGILLYSTCSIMYEENEDIVIEFLKNNPDFEPSQIMPGLSNYGISIPDLTDTDFYLRVEPSNLESDGFFMARIKKL